MDVLVDRRYEVSLAQALGYRGLVNQQIIRLTEAISREDAHGGQPGKVEVTISDGQLTVIGVPAAGFLVQLREGLARRVWWWIQPVVGDFCSPAMVAAAGQCRVGREATG